ncbi:MAG TPA: PAS domain S-box protein [Verrucomicrobiales bacterium]|nr:PAS domain S-box protein [Verrucomicrobiales bacterium]HIL68985.1 PAS domain S-box protein [Verrucomicrobiota bacterium]
MRSSNPPTKNCRAAVVLNSSDAITLQDESGKLVSWNMGAERMYGYSEEEALKMNISEILPKKILQDELRFFFKKN